MNEVGFGSLKLRRLAWNLAALWTDVQDLCWRKFGGVTPEYKLVGSTSQSPNILKILLWYATAGSLKLGIVSLEHQNECIKKLVSPPL